VRVLVTNDDGVEAEGVRALARAIVHAGHEVVVVAPSGERSGSGAAIGRLHRSGPIRWQPVTWADLPDTDVHSVDLPPAAAVYAGCLGAFGPAPDAVASGVNPGLNYGHLVLHSGTVGAALTAQVLGIPAVAVSLGWGEDEHWATAATIAASALPWLADQDRPCALNLNVPNVELSAVGSARQARLTAFDEQWSGSAARGELVLEFEGRARDPEPDTDLAIVRAGDVAFTLLSGITEASVAPASTAPASSDGLAETLAQAVS